MLIEDVLNVLPADATYGHGMPRRLRLAALRREQGADNLISVREFGEIVSRAELHRTDGGRDVAVTC